jgi:cyclophilin family peptidyl-prolyl cis-trans isomerase
MLMRIAMNKFVFLSVLAIALFTSASGQEEAETVEAPADPQVTVETSAGNFVIELFSTRAPLSVNNFLQYVNGGFYNGTVFHRIVGGFVVQGGGYDTDYQLKTTRPDIPNESGNGLNNRRGYVAMARSGEPHSANAQFYINLADNLPLDPRPTRWGYAVFGKVIEGMEVVDEIGYRPTGAGPTPELGKDVPKEPIVITRISIVPAAERLKSVADETPAAD